MLQYTGSAVSVLACNVFIVHGLQNADSVCRVLLAESHSCVWFP